MRKAILNLIVMTSAFSPCIQAATENLRFEGLIGSAYGANHAGYDASLGFVPRQSVYFDFQIDTNLNATGHPDSAYTDNFAATYLAGSIAGSNVTYGSSVSYPEGTTTWLFVTDSLRVGMSHADLYPYPDDDSISTWIVGDRIRLMNKGYLSPNIIGDLTMTFRTSSPLPVYVPIPAALWLFVSGLGLFSFVNRKRR